MIFSQTPFARSNPAIRFRFPPLQPGHAAWYTIWIQFWIQIQFWFQKGTNEDEASLLQSDDDEEDEEGEEGESTDEEQSRFWWRGFS